MSATVWIAILLFWSFLVWLVLGMLRIGAEADRRTEIALREMLGRQTRIDGDSHRKEGLHGA